MGDIEALALFVVLVFFVHEDYTLMHRYEEKI